CHSCSPDEIRRRTPSFPPPLWGKDRSGIRGDSTARRTHSQFVPSRNLNRWIFPVAVFGSESTTSIQRGYFHGPIFCLTCSFSISCKSVVVAPGRSTTKAFGFNKPSGS